MGAGASIPIEKWSAYRLAAYSNEKVNMMLKLLMHSILHLGYP